MVQRLDKCLKIVFILSLMLGLIFWAQPSAQAASYSFSISTSMPDFDSNLTDFPSYSSSSDGLIVYSAHNYLYKSTDAGATWSRVTAVSTSNVYGISVSSDGTKIAAALYNGNLWVSLDSGVNWSAKNSSRKWTDVAISDDGLKIYAVVDGGYIYRSSDSGATWDSSTADTNGGSLNIGWSSVTTSSNGTIVYATGGGKIYKSSDSGVTWVKNSTNFGSCCFIVSTSADANRVFLGSNGNGFYLSSDSGATFTRQTAIISETHDAPNVWGYGSGISRNGKYLAALSLGDYFYLSDDFGATWEKQSAQGQNQWAGRAAVTDDGKFVLGATNYGWWPISQKTLYIAGGSSGSGSSSSDEAAKAREAERIRQEKIESARRELVQNLNSGDKLTRVWLQKADLPGLHQNSIEFANVEITNFIKEKFMEFSNLQFIVGKFHLVEVVGSQSPGSAYVNQLIAYGILPRNTPQKSLIFSKLKKLDPSQRDSIADIQTFTKNMVDVYNSRIARTLKNTSKSR